MFAQLACLAPALETTGTEQESGTNPAVIWRLKQCSPNEGATRRQIPPQCSDNSWHIENGHRSNFRVMIFCFIAKELSIFSPIDLVNSIMGCKAKHHWETYQQSKENMSRYTPNLSLQTEISDLALTNSAVHKYQGPSLLTGNISDTFIPSRLGRSSYCGTFLGFLQLRVSQLWLPWEKIRHTLCSTNARYA